MALSLALHALVMTHISGVARACARAEHIVASFLIDVHNASGLIASPPNMQCRCVCASLPLAAIAAVALLASVLPTCMHTITCCCRMCCWDNSTLMSHVLIPLLQPRSCRIAVEYAHCRRAAICTSAATRHARIDIVAGAMPNRQVAGKNPFMRHRATCVKVSFR